MSEFVRHEPCPNCGSRDNLARYSDGHAWCFGCKYLELPSGISYIRSSLYNNNNKEKEHKDVNLPADFSYSIPPSGLSWLSKYNLTIREIRENRVGWSDEGIKLTKKNLVIAPLLVFPVFDLYGNLLFWQGRNFGNSGPKYITKGYKEDTYHIIENVQGDRTRIVLVEDVVSAIKVSRVCNAMPIFGSTISLKRIRTLSERFSRLTLWLDMDKQIEARKTALKASVLFDKVDVVASPLDPKEYSTDEIEKYLSLQSTVSSQNTSERL